MIQQSRLENGLQIATNRLEGRNSIGLAIWVRVGGRHESKRLSGISHFVEHMLFKGTETRSTKRIKEEIEGIGGSMNAFTGEESTCYFVKVPKPHFADSFAVLQDMVNHSTFKPDEIKKERTVILEEIKMYLDQPSQHVHEMIGELLWPNHALGRTISGTCQTVNRIRRVDLLRHLESYYHPQNLLVTTCGDLEHDEVHRLAVQFFGSRKKKHPSSFQTVQLRPRARRSRLCFLQKQTEQTHFVLAFHGLSRTHPKRYHMAILNVLLGGNMSSRLFEEVRERRGLAYEIRSSIGFFEDTGALSISAGVEPNKAPLALRVIMRELDRLRKKTISKNELQRAKDYFQGQLLLGLEDTLDNILWFGERILYRDSPPKLRDIQREVEKVMPDDVKRMANQLFNDQNVHLALIGPHQEKYRKRTEAEIQLS